LRRLLRVEVEPEEGGGDAEPEHGHEHGAERDDQADRAEVRRVEVARVEREQEDREDARDDPAEPVDHGVSSEPAELVPEGHR
jgi:hypothetical protein